MKEKKDDAGMDPGEAEKKAKKIAESIFAIIAGKEGSQLMMDELIPLWLNSAIAGNEFFNSIQFTKPERGTIFAVFRDDYLTWLNTYGTQRITYVNQTTKDLTQAIINDGLIHGDSISTIATNLGVEIEQYSMRRSMTIAETEIHNTFMQGNFMSATSSGFKNKTWITAGDGHVRDSHKALNNKTVKMDDEFKPGLRYPGDPNAPARETIKCRCILYYT